jgi:hypothetical protein
MKTKKELKEEYKQMKIPMGVFQIKNIVNNKVLIDNSIDMESKWNRHKMELKFGNHRNRTFQKDWNDYGENNFYFEVLSELKNNEEENVNYNKELKALENMVIEELNIESRY